MKTLNGLDENTVIRCPTKGDANRVLRIIKDAGYKWVGGPEIDPCDNEYVPKNIFYSISPRGLDFGYSYHEGKTILPASEFLRLNAIERGCPFDEAGSMGFSTAPEPKAKVRLYKAEIAHDLGIEVEDLEIIG